MQVLILGGTGFIGPTVVERLAAAGHRVALFHRGRSEENAPPGVQHVHGDRARFVRDAESLFGVESPSLH